MHFRTRAVHTRVSTDKSSDALTTSIRQSATPALDDLETATPYDSHQTAIPTRVALAQRLASLEGGVGAVCCSTGVAAETLVLMGLTSGDHVLASDDLHGGTHRRLSQVMRTRWNLDVTFVRMTDLEAARKALRPRTRLLWIETPAGPRSRILDIRALVAWAKEHGLRVVTDNTLASPYFQRPLELGSDLVLHSTMKYLAGHRDVEGGAVVARAPELLADLEFHSNALGLLQAPFDSWLVLRGLKTLALRMKAHETGAFEIAEFLASHSKVGRVFFPGLPEHDGHDIAQGQMSGFPALVSFELESEDAARRLAARTRLFELADCLGGTASFIDLPYSMSHSSMSVQERERRGITPGLARLSVGLEDPEDLLEDLDLALGRD